MSASLVAGESQVLTPGGHKQPPPGTGRVQRKFGLGGLGSHNAMSGKHLRGVDNTTIRRRIMRAERDILPKMLRGFETPRRGGAMHAVHGPDPDPAPQPAPGPRVHVIETG